MTRHGTCQTTATPRTSPRHRAAIDALDREILARLNERAAPRAGDRRAEGAAAAAYRPEREAQVLARAQSPRTRGRCRRGGRRRVPAGDVGVPRAGAAAARSPTSGPAGTFCTRPSAKHFGTFVDAMPLRDDRRSVPRGGSRQHRLRRRAGRELHRGRGRPHARPHVHDAAVDLRRDQAARSARTCCRTRRRSPR